MFNPKPIGVLRSVFVHNRYGQCNSRRIIARVLRLVEKEIRRRDRVRIGVSASTAESTPSTPVGLQRHDCPHGFTLGAMGIDAFPALVRPSDQVHRRPSVARSIQSCPSVCTGL